MPVIIEFSRYIGTYSSAKFEYLIENHYFEINDFSENGMTILHFAVKKNSVNVCKYLLEQGANQNILDAEGKTAYDYVLENSYEI